MKKVVLSEADRRTMQGKPSPALVRELRTKYGATEAELVAAIGRAALPIAQELVRRPEPIHETDEFVSKAGHELRSFHAGNEYGYKRGHDAGYGRGVATGIFGILLLGLAGYAIAGSRTR